MSVMDNIPTVTVEIDFTNTPVNATRSWTDVTPFVRRVSYTRSGRNDELARTEPGVLNELVLDNRDGRFSPDNTSSPYYPNVKRNRWCRISGTWNGTTYRRWTGLIQGFGRSWTHAGKDATTRCTGVDASAVLNLITLDDNLVSRPVELSSARVSAVLSLLPSVTSSLDTGIVFAPAITFANQDFALPHLLAVEDTEGGLLFVDADGTYRFQNRDYRQVNSRATTSQGTISDTNGIPYTPELDEELDDAFWYNTATITPADGTPETWENTTATTNDFQRHMTASILDTSQVEAINRAQYIVARYSEPGARIPDLLLIGAKAPSQWPTILGARNSDRFTWQLGTTSRDGYLERVSETITPDNWQTTFSLSPVDDDAVWLAGVSTLGDDTVAGY